MRTVPHLIAAAATMFFLAAAPVAAEPSGSSTQQKKKDPNEMVCEKEPMLGSRLQMRKTCMTRAQWAERRQLDRATVERSQTQLCATVGGRCMAGD